MAEGLPVHGYRPQDDKRVALVNQHKIIEEKILRHIAWQKNEHRMLDPRWAAVAVTHFEQAFMALNRAVFQPERVNLTSADVPGCQAKPGPKCDWPDCPCVIPL